MNAQVEKLQVTELGILETLQVQTEVLCYENLKMILAERITSTDGRFKAISMFLSLVKLERF